MGRGEMEEIAAEKNHHELTSFSFFKDIYIYIYIPLTKLRKKKVSSYQ